MKKRTIILFIIGVVVFLGAVGFFVMNFTGFAVLNNSSPNSEKNSYTPGGILEKRPILPTEQCPGVDLKVENNAGNLMVKRGPGRPDLSGNLTFNVFVDDSPVNSSDYMIKGLGSENSFGDESTEARLFIRNYNVGRVAVVIRDKNGDCPR